MQNITAKQGQSFFDIVLEATGSITNVIEMAKANDVGITDVPAVGQSLKIAGTINKNMVALLSGRFAPATLKIDIPPAPELDYLLPQTFPFL